MSYVNAFARSALLAAAIAAGACYRSAQPAASPPPISSAAALQLIADYDRAWNTKDEVRLNEILNDRYVYFSSKGALWPRSRVLGMVLSPHYKLASATRTELEVFVQGAAATVSSRWRGTGTFKEHVFTDDQRCGLTLIPSPRVPGKLQVLSETCTQIAR